MPKQLEIPKMQKNAKKAVNVENAKCKKFIKS